MARILIVDDDKSLTRSLEKYLREVGFEVETAEDFDHAQQQLRRMDFDVVVVDIILPRVSGVELLKRVRAQAPDTQVIMMTGKPTVETAVEAVRAGAHDYLVKPFEKTTLKHAVERAAGLKELLEEKVRLEAANREYRENLERLVEQRTRSLQENEVLYQSLVEHLPQYIFRKDLQGHYTFVNQEFCRSLGKTAPEVLGKASRDLFPADLATRYEADDEWVAATGQTLDREQEYSSIDGTLRWVRVVKSPLFGVDQRVSGLQGILWDITDRKETETALQASEEKFRLAFENANTGMCLVDLDGRLIKVNNHMSAIFGYPREVLERMRVNDIALPEDQYLSPDFIREARSGMVDNIVFEKRYLHRDGREVCCQVSSSLVRDGSGAPQYFISQLEDITERRRMEVALREAEKKYRHFFENAIEGIFQTSTDGRILVANPALAKMFGYASPEEMIASVHSVAEQLYVNPEDRREFVRLIAGRGEVKEFQVRQRKKDGTPFWTSFNARAVQDAAGNIVCYEGRVEDITEQKQAQAISRRYQLLSKHARDIILFISRDGRILEANEAAFHAYGYDREEMLALHIHDLRAPHTRHETDELIEKAFAEGFSIETEHQRKDGQVFPVESNSRGVDAGGEKVLLSVIRDITRRRRAEEERKRLEGELRQAQKLEALGTLAGGIAHDFNNILGIIMGYAEISALTLADDAPEKASLAEIIQATHRAKELVKQILTFSRKSEQERLPLQLTPIVKEAMKLLRASLPATIEIRQEIELPQGHDVMLGDQTQMQQLLMNLSSNAAYAMREKGGVLQISLSAVSLTRGEVERNLELDAGDYVKLIVADTGHGMDRATLERIFEPYFTTKGPGEGTGLGLAVVHGIVKGHHGAITVESEREKGTVFQVYFPRLPNYEPPKGDTFTEVPAGSERILLVDDEEMLVNAHKQMLTRLGYRVTAVTSSKDALSRFREHPDGFDVIVSDYTMPHMTGLDLAQHIRQLRPDIPIIVCTGFSEKISEEGMKKRGIAALLMKPVSLKHIAEVIRRVLAVNAGGCP